LLTFHRRPAKPLRPAGPVQRHRRHRSFSGVSVTAIGSTIGARLAATFLSFVAGVIAARELGEHGRGVLALLIAVPAAFSVLGVVGLDTANLRFAGRSHTAFLRIIRIAVLFSLLAGTAISAAWLAAGARWPAVRLGLSPGLALLCAMLCPITVLLTLLGAAEVGRGRIQVFNLVTAGAVAAYLVAIAVLAASGQLTVIRCFASYAASQIFSVIVLLLAAGRPVHEAGERVPLREYSGYSLRAYLPNIAQYGMLRMDVPVIQILAGTNAVALYAVALPFAEAMLLLPIAVSLVMFPQITSGTLSRRETGEISRAVLAGSAMLAGSVALIIPIAVPLIYGSVFRGSVLVIWCMLPGVVIFGAGRTVQTYLAGTDRLGPVILASGAGIAAGFVSLIALSPRFGAAGAGAADSIGYFAYAAVILRWTRRDGPLAVAGARAVSRCRQAGTAMGAVAASATSVSRLTIFGCAIAATGALAAAVLSTGSISSLLAILAVLVAIIAVASPATGCYLLAVAIPVTQTPRGVAVISVRDLLALIVACLIGQIAAGRAARPRTFTAAVAAACAGYFLLSAILVGGQGATSKDLLNVAELSIPLLCLPLILRAGPVARHAAIVFSFATACLAVVEVGMSRASAAAAGNFSAVTNAAIAAGQTGAVDHNVEGALFVLALCVFLARFPHTRHGLGKLAVTAAIIAMVAGVAYSFSRESYFGALAVFIVFALRRPRHGLIGAAALAGVLLFLAPSTITARISSIWQGSSLDASSAVRLDLWTSALRMFAHQPLLGVGYLHFAGQLPAYFVSTGNDATPALQLSALVYAHSTYLTVLAETGIIGGALLATLILAGWRRIWPAARAGDEAGECALLAFVGLGVCSIFGEPLFAPALLAAFLLIVLAAGPRWAGLGGKAADTAAADA
jgi:O-antigen/teichoic acid export membrane protein/O-antigen ligase